MDIHGYPCKNDMDMDMDMDGIFLIHGKPDCNTKSIEYKLLLEMISIVGYKLLSQISIQAI